MQISPSRHPEITDVGFYEIIAASAAAKKFISDIKNSKRGNFSDFIILNRKYFVCLAAFAGKNGGKRSVTVTNISAPESLHVERGIKINKLSEKWKDKSFLFEHEGHKYLNDLDPYKCKGTYHYNVQKEEFFFLQNDSKIPYPLTDVLAQKYVYLTLDRNQSIKNIITRNYSDNNHINFENLAKRLNLTCKFGFECDNLSGDFSQYVPILKGYQIYDIMPLVGTLRSLRDDSFIGHTVANFLCGIDIPDSQRNKPLEKLVPKLDHHLPYMLYENPKLHESVSDCHDIDIPKLADKDRGWCYTYKLIVRRRGENRVYVLYNTVFSKNIIHSGDREILPIFQYENYFQEKGFDVYLDRSTMEKDEKGKKYSDVAFTAFKIRKKGNDDEDEKKSSSSKGITTTAIGTVSASSLLFVAVNGQQSVLAFSDGAMKSESFTGNIEEYVSTLENTESSFLRYYPMDDNSAVMAIGNVHHTKTEHDLLSKAMDQAGIAQDDDFVSSVVGESFSGGSIGDDSSSDDGDGSDTIGYDDNSSIDATQDYGSRINDPVDPGSSSVSSNGSIPVQPTPDSSIILPAVEPVIDSTVSSSALSSIAVSAGAATTSAITTKSITVSVIAVMLVTSGAYIANPEFFGITRDVRNLGVGPPVSSDFLQNTDTILTNYSNEIETEQDAGYEDPTLQITSESIPVSEFIDSDVPIGVIDDESDAITDISELGYDTSVVSTALILDDFQLNTVFKPFVSVDGWVRDIATDQDDNFYVLQDQHIDKFDSDGNPILKIPIDTSTIYTEIVVDSFQNVYLAKEGTTCSGLCGDNILDGHIAVFDSSGNPIEKIFHVDDSKINPRHIDIDSKNYLYIANAFPHKIMVLDPSHNLVKQLNVDGYDAMWVDNGDNIYVGNTDVSKKKSTVQKFDPDGNLLLEFNPGTKGGHFRSISHIVGDEDHIYVADTSNGKIQKFSLQGEPMENVGIPRSESGNLSNPQGLSVHSDGIYVADTDNHRIQLFDRNGNFVLTFGSYGTGEGQFNRPTKIVSEGPDKDLYVLNRGIVQKFDPQGIFMLDFKTPNAKDLDVDSAGTIIVLNADNSITKISPEGKFTENIIPNVDESCNTAVFCTLVRDHIYIASYKDWIEKFDLEGNLIQKFDVKNNVHSVDGIYVDSQDHIYLSTFVDDNSVLKFDSSGQLVLKFDIGEEEFRESEITVDDKDFIYVSNLRGDNILKFDETGNLITKFGSNYDDLSQIDHPVGLAMYKSSILFADQFSNQITQISFEEAVTTFSEKFNQIKCDANSMINDPIQVPQKITAALPTSELMSRADNLTFDTRQYEEGMLFYYITSQIQPTNVNAWNGIGYTQTQICPNDSAVIAYGQALSLDPDNDNAKIGLADYTINQVNNGDMHIISLEDAEIQLQSILESDSRSLNALNALGYIEILRENYDMSVVYYQKSLEIDSDRATTLNGLALSNLRSGELDEAIKNYNKVITYVDPTNLDALAGLITIHVQQDSPELAKPFIDKLAESNGVIKDKLIEQANWLQKNGQTQEAQRLFDAAAKLK